MKKQTSMSTFSENELMMAFILIRFGLSHKLPYVQYMDENGVTNTSLFTDLTGAYSALSFIEFVTWANGISLSIDNEERRSFISTVNELIPAEKEFYKELPEDKWDDTYLVDESTQVQIANILSPHFYSLVHPAMSLLEKQMMRTLAMHQQIDMILFLDPVRELRSYGTIHEHDEYIDIMATPMYWRNASDRAVAHMMAYNVMVHPLLTNVGYFIDDSRLKDIELYRPIALPHQHQQRYDDRRVNDTFIVGILTDYEPTTPYCDVVLYCYTSKGFWFVDYDSRLLVKVNPGELQESSLNLTKSVLGERTMAVDAILSEKSSTGDGLVDVLNDINQTLRKS
jgi:hypothetical protein